MSDPQLPSGWFPDPLERYDHRWFNGTSWTSDVSIDGRLTVDPLGTAPSPAGSSGSGNGIATAALVCGLVGIAIAWIPFLVVGGIALGILGIVFGVKGLRRSRTAGRGRGPAITGIIGGIVALLLSIVGVVLSVVVVREAIAFIEPGPRYVDDVECTIDGREASVTGTITNLDDERHDYTVFVTVENVTRYVEVTDVEPDEVAEWGVRLDGSFRDLDVCDPDIIVNGPFPFGIETDPVQD